ncbi:macrophage colony-stimulating factor 1 receptor [Clupea harengus]|uniref:Platelet-derived growth factor receptor-like protein n=1 Tax=Clupea harengus TaxID=7950 RepID=A0A8M1KQE5_CLUHA|nr:macrophage colony-stimulating factor 1 receptor [Clupea harengus]
MTVLRAAPDYSSLLLYGCPQLLLIKRLDSDVILNVSSPLVLQCRGDALVTWQPRLARHKKHIVKGYARTQTQTFRVLRAEAEHTGTYKCVYTNTSLKHIYSTVHVYVGESCVLPCLITNPTLAPITLRLANGSAPPPDLNFTSDPHKGVKLLQLSHTHTGDYVCSAHSGDQLEIFSRTFSINVIPRLQAPPYVFLQQTKYVRIVGEELKISCTTHNPNFNYNITWIHNSSHALRVEEDVKSKGSQLDIESIYTIPEVTADDSGYITCVGTNEAGINSSSTHLQVIDEAYVRLRVVLPSELVGGGGVSEVSEGEDVEVQLLIEAYPDLTTHTWILPYNSTNKGHIYRHGPYRWEASLLLRRVNYQEQGLYTFTALSPKADASISFTLLMYPTPAPPTPTILYL